MFGIGSLFSGAVALVGSIFGTVVKGVCALATNLLPIIDKTGGIICGVAGIFAGKPQLENPEEIARMVEIGAEQGISFEDFDSTHAFLEKIRAEIQIDKNDFEQMNVETKLAYRAIGNALYIKDLGEQLEMDLENPDFWKFVNAANFTVKEVSVLIDSMKERNIENADEVVLYANGKLEPGSTEQHLVFGALKDMYQKEYPQLNCGEVNEKIIELQEKVNNFEKGEK